VTLASTRALRPEEYRDFFHTCDQGFCVIEVLLDAAGRPFDYHFLDANRAFEAQSGLTDAVGKTALELVPDLERYWIETYGAVALTGGTIRVVQESAAMGRWFDVFAARIGAPERRMVAVTFTDVTAHRKEQAERRLAEQALRHSEERFRAFADAAPAMLWVTEPDGRCSYLSRGWYDFTGQKAEDALGFGWLSAVHPLDRDRAQRAFVAANERHEPFELEHRLRRSDGVYRYVIDAGQPRFGCDGAFEGYVGSVIDIHERRSAEERLDLAVNSGEVGLWYCDLPFDKLVWNNHVKAHFGLPADAEVTINTFYERMHPDDRVSTRAAIDEAIARRVTYDTRYRTVGLDGVTRWIRAIGGARYENGQPVRFDGITVDVTELVALRDAAEEASRAKDEFLAMLGHELRNPLAPIMTALQLLKLRGVAAIEHERGIIERQVRHLVRLVDDLLDVSRITRGMVELQKERVTLADTVARAAEMAGPLLEQRRHELSVDVPRDLVVDGDPARLAQVVANLLSNAAKYTEPGGSVSVVGTVDGDHIRLTVRDSGVGIDEAMLRRVFDLFVQERQSLARSDGGLGLGLAIVRSLVELHGGTVSAHSDGRGKGSEFTIRLPHAVLRDARTEDVAAPDAVPASGPTGVRVLVVDDNVDAGAMLALMLESFGHEARVVVDGPSALTEAARFQPDVALVDLGLPVMDGFELAERLSAQAAHPVTLIAVTGYGQARDRHASADAGFAAHLVKPVDMDELREVLDRARAI
jgi:PAS domain S-box-containing protein